MAARFTKRSMAQTTRMRPYASSSFERSSTGFSEVPGIGNRYAPYWNRRIPKDSSKIIELEARGRCLKRENPLNSAAGEHITPPREFSCLSA